MNLMSLFNFFSSENKDNIIVNEIVKQIDNCCNNIAIMNPADERAFQEKLKTLAENLRVYFNSRYCAIGKVDDKDVEDCTASWVNDNPKNIITDTEKKFKQVKRVSVTDIIV